jgi:hypothetical protein
MAVRDVLLMLSMTAAAAPASAGLVFSETEVIEVGTAPAVRQLRRVFIQGSQLKSVVEESTDPLVSAGTFTLAVDGDPVVIDPVLAIVAPRVPTNMEPVQAPPSSWAAADSGFVLELLSEERGPMLHGLPTRHYVYLLRYPSDGRDAPRAGPAVSMTEERHEFWASDLPVDDPALSAWERLRAAEDSAGGPARRELAGALAAMREDRFLLRYSIERHRITAADTTEAVERERVQREITAVSVEEIPAETFAKPAGLLESEFLVPGPVDAFPAKTLHREGVDDSRSPWAVVPAVE